MSSSTISAPTPFVIGGRRALTPLCLLFLFDSSFSGSGLPFAHPRSLTRIFPYFPLKRLISLSSHSHYQPPALSIPTVLAAEMSAFDEKLGRLDSMQISLQILCLHRIQRYAHAGNGIVAIWDQDTPVSLGPGQMRARGNYTWSGISLVALYSRHDYLLTTKSKKNKKFSYCRCYF
jgi:hypothetical protein